MKQKIIKILNILKKFTLNDLSLYLETDIENIEEYIKILISEGQIKQISSTEYVYIINKEAKLERKLNQKTIERMLNFESDANEIFNLENFREFPAEKVFTRKSDLDYYKKCDERMKKLLIKNIVLFNLAGDMEYTSLKKYLKMISDKYPEYKMNAQWYRIKYKRYLEEGLPGLYHNKFSTIDNEVYEEFKNIYLNSNKFSLEESYEILLKKGYDANEIPTYHAFRHRLNKEYSKDAIKKMRTHNKKIADSTEVEFLKIHKKRKNPNTIPFKIAANDYYQAIKDNQIESAKTRIQSIKKLIDYFKDIQLGDITKDKIIKFKDVLLDKGVDFNSVKYLMSLLFTILQVNGIDIDYDIYYELKHTYKIYNFDEIRDIVLQDTPKAWIIVLGLRLSELKALKYEDIDFENNIVTVKRRNEFGNIKEYSTQKFVRDIKVPQFLLKRILPVKQGYIFGDINISEYESCIYTHIKLLQMQNISLNLISKQMGYKNINTFYQIFHNLFPKTFEKDFNILKPLNLGELAC